MTSDTQILSGRIIIIIKIKENPNKHSRVQAHLVLGLLSNNNNSFLKRRKKKINTNPTGPEP